jgi:hypothetical protein
MRAGETVMPVQMLVMTFKLDMPPAEYVRAVRPLAEEILNVPGLRWKIWLIDEAQRRAGGICFFDDSTCLQAFLASPWLDRLLRRQSLTDLRVLPFDVLEAETALTHGPIGTGVRV